MGCYSDTIRSAHWLLVSEQLQPNSASGSGALEHDPSSIYLRVPVGEAIPGPLPLGVSVIDASVALFGVVFPHVSFKHRSELEGIWGHLGRFGKIDEHKVPFCVVQTADARSLCRVYKASKRSSTAGGPA